ncbi:hypothetical protein [Hydrogenophaga sp. PAMC20947]|uniref:hypothetical protein n=1 Tax=Hydrogenophaga sp. PAMC20947 TaxID=2565558 RepID=UPI00109E1A7A|nr:hypothetical protein [Hydrogenophaga sp. PAMC20947]QCB47807.1 hypothetical protein E5678_18285 [Hydrogenophaga sp. PAMC20947]
MRLAVRTMGLGIAMLLAGCSLMPERVPLGATRSEIENRLGQPTSVYALADGTRLQYSRQPAGQQVYNLDLDGSGHLRQTEQVMAAAWLQRIEVGRWTRETAELYLGRPALVERVASWDGDIWTYRFQEITGPRQVHLHLDAAGVVRRVMFTDEPLPEAAADFGR